MSDEVENKTLSFNGRLKLTEENGEWYIKDRDTDQISGPLHIEEISLESNQSITDFAGDNLSVDEGGSLNASVEDEIVYNDEKAQDAVNSLLTAGSNISLTYDDESNSLTVDSVDTDTQPVAFGDSTTESGDGSTTTFNLSHSMGKEPSTASVQSRSADAVGEFYVSSKTSSDIEITYMNAPPSGTTNLEYDIVLIE